MVNLGRPQWTEAAAGGLGWACPRRQGPTTARPTAATSVAARRPEARGGSRAAGRCGRTQASAGGYSRIAVVATSRSAAEAMDVKLLGATAASAI